MTPTLPPTSPGVWRSFTRADLLFVVHMAARSMVLGIVAAGFGIGAAVGCSQHDPHPPNLDDESIVGHRPTSTGDGGVREAGVAGDGGTPGLATGCGTYDGSNVYLLGVLQQDDAFTSTAPLEESPSAFCSAFRSHAAAVVRPDKKLVYIESDTNKLRVFVPDGLHYDSAAGQWRYADAPETNDTEIADPCAAAGATPQQLFVQPDTGKIVVACSSGYDIEEGGRVVNAPGTRVFALGSGGRRLLMGNDGILYFAGPDATSPPDAGADAGPSFVVVALPSYAHAVTARSHGDGFSLAVELNPPDMQLGHMDSSGRTTDVQNLDSPPAGVLVHSAGARLSADDHLYEMGTSAATPAIDVVVGRGGSSALLYSEANAPAGTPTWTGTSPVLYLLMQNSTLATGP